jgi:hypothetical protein
MLGPMRGVRLLEDGTLFVRMFNPKFLYNKTRRLPSCGVPFPACTVTL